MKNILITGAESYIGTEFDKWMKKYPESYYIETIDVKSKHWGEADFSRFDVVLHVAGIVHMKEKQENADLYFKINRDLAIQVAKKAKQSGIKQFILLSSLSVYGIAQNHILIDTKEVPTSNYGKSKLEADKYIKALQDNCFKVAILRPPMIYGKGCKGNYQLLSKISKITPVFPDVSNKRSMLYIGNLVIFIQKIIDNYESGTFIPQNSEYVCTSEMVKEIALCNRHRVLFFRALTPFLIIKQIKILNKIFGDLTCEMENACTEYSLSESIKETEK